MKFTIEMLTRRVDYARFSRVYFSEALNSELVAAIDLKQRTLRERSDLPDGKQRMRLYIAPRVDVPAVIEKLIEGHAIGYEEVTVFDPAARHAHATIHTPAPDLLQVSAETQFLEELDGIRTRIELQVRVKIIGIGAMIERFVGNETRKRYVLVERCLQRFVDENRDLAGATLPA
jgi:hypothetical protein